MGKLEVEDGEKYLLLLLLFAKFPANAEIQKIVHQLSAHNTPKSPLFWMILSALESAEVGRDDVHIK